MQSHYDYWNHNAKNPTFLAFPALMDACPSELKEAYTALRRTLFELYKQHTRVLIETENNMKMKKWRVKTEKQKVKGMMFYAGKAIKTLIVMLLEDATTCKDALEM
jgi:hypothetical protein